MVERNTKYVKRNALRISQNANAKELIKRANELSGSVLALQEQANEERMEAFKKTISDYQKNYHVNSEEAFDIIQRASHFSGEQASIFLKMISGEPVHLAHNNDGDLHNPQD